MPAPEIPTTLFNGPQTPGAEQPLGSSTREMLQLCTEAVYSQYRKDSSTEPFQLKSDRLHSSFRFGAHT